MENTNNPTFFLIIKIYVIKFYSSHSQSKPMTKLLNYNFKLKHRCDDLLKKT